MTTTYEEATLFMSVMNWGTLLGIDDALAAIFSPDSGELSMDDPNVRKVLSFAETAGALVKHGVLNVDLLRDVFWIDGIWARVSAHALAAREHEGEPTLYENFEALVKVRAIA
jgi:hypothetical protein